MSILQDIEDAAYDVRSGRIKAIRPVAKNFNVVRQPSVMTDRSYCVAYSYGTEVVTVVDTDAGRQTILVDCDAFHHSTTTSRHVRRFLEGLVNRPIDWGRLYDACDRQSEKVANGVTEARTIILSEAM